MIPKIIHQTWKNKDLPPTYQRSRKSWIEKHPQWKYILWTDEMNRTLIAQEFPWFLKYYDNYEYNIQRADVIRYFILWKYGGIYADMDILCQRPLDSLLQKMERDSNDLAFAKSSHLDYYSNWFIISSRQNSFWPLLLSSITRAYDYAGCWQCVSKHFKVMYTTGPAIVNETLEQNNVECLALDSGFNDCGVCDLQPCVCKDCYIKNLNSGSWNGWDSKLLNWILCKWQYMAILLLAIFILLVAMYPCLRSEK